jgi:hypothetical protein
MTEQEKMLREWTCAIVSNRQNQNLQIGLVVEKWYRSLFWRNGRSIRSIVEGLIWRSCFSADVGF